MTTTTSTLPLQERSASREAERPVPPTGRAIAPFGLPDERTRTGSELVVETRGLTKRYGERIVAVNNLDLRVRRGEVYGFLGPNGAGKTTTLRMLLGLVRPTSGSAVVAGARPGSTEGLVRIGAMIEAPAFYPFLSGRDNLRVLARHAGVPEGRIEAALEVVELGARAGDRFGTYSQGMKQRLGLAAALFKDPELLILDEPTNGLDPAGMVEMRSLIRGLGRDGRTVLLSSHLLGEVEQICDRVGVIRRGELVAEGTVAELRGRDSLRILAEPLDRAQALVAAFPGVEHVEIDDDALRVMTDRVQTAAINRALVGAGIAVGELHWERPPLEEVFLELTGGTEEAA
jgi:ABC-2 type transport system ATP-binding protein